MYNTQFITEDLIYVGVNDRDNNLSYNAYLLLDDYTVLFDTVPLKCGDRFFENIKHALNDRKLDYWILDKLSDNVVFDDLLLRYPEVRIISSPTAYRFNTQTSLPVKFISVDHLETGDHALNFLFNDILSVCFDKKDKILFSFDLFSSIGAIDGLLYTGKDQFENWVEESRELFINANDYFTDLKIIINEIIDNAPRMILPKHGKIIEDGQKAYLENYLARANGTPDQDGVLMIYPQNKYKLLNALEVLATELATKGAENVKISRLSIDDLKSVALLVFKYSRIVFAISNDSLSDYRALVTFLKGKVDLYNRKIALVFDSLSQTEKDFILDNDLSESLLDEPLELSDNLEECRIDLLNMAELIFADGFNY